MKPESREEIFERHLAEAEAAITRQRRLIAELRREGHSTTGSEILLGLLEETARQAREALATLRFTKTHDAPGASLDPR